METSEIRPLMVGGRVYERTAYSPDVIPFTNAQYRFLHAYRLEIPIEDAASKSGLTVQQAERFLAKPKTIEWLKDRALKDHIKREWEEPGKWYQVGEEMRNKEEVPKHQVDIWKEFGDRVCPKTSRNADSGNTTRIEISIDPGAHERSLQRRAAIEAQIVKDENVA